MKIEGSCREVSNDRQDDRMAGEGHKAIDTSDNEFAVAWWTHGLAYSG